MYLWIFTKEVAMRLTEFLHFLNKGKKEDLRKYSHFEPTSEDYKLRKRWKKLNPPLKVGAKIMKDIFE